MAGLPNEATETELPAEPVRSVFPTAATVSLVGIFIIMMIASLYLARALVLPVVLATLLTFTATPLVRWFARRGVSPVISAVLLIAIIAGIVLGGITLLRGPIADMVTQAPQIAQTLRDRFESVRKPFEMLSQASRTVSNPPPPGDGSAAPVTVVGQQPSILDWLLGTVADVGSTIVATLLLAPFLLASTETLKLKLIRLFPMLSDKKRSLRVLSDIEHRVSRYLVTVTAINSCLGICIGVAMWALGMPNPALWGVGATLLNFIPYIGPVTGIGLTAAASLTLHTDLLTAAAPPVAYAVLNSIEGTFVTPFIVGRRLQLSIVAILITLGLTTWMWGIIGTLMGVPLLVVVKAFCDELPSLAPLGMFISAESEPLPEPMEAAAASNGAQNATAATLAAPRPDHAI